MKMDSQEPIKNLHTKVPYSCGAQAKYLIINYQLSTINFIANCLAKAISP